MRIDRIEEARLSRADDAAIGALVTGAWPDFDGRSFHMQRHHVRLVARDPGIVGHIAICLRAIRMGERLVDIAGLAEVATDPDRRGEGIASALLGAAIAEARATTADFLVLFGTAGLYAAQGFVAQPNPLRWVELDGARTGRVREGANDALMVMPLGALDWDAGVPVDMLGHLF